ncbi:MAG: high frequency lysogenization protein HflD [Gammaproteobacteria bacterium]|nr:high frequency lysogenization protein HflD [Gammaproteobacteria bacterium]
MTHNIAERTLALAALFQATQLVQHVARRGQASDSDIEACIGSLFHLDAPSTEAIYGGAQNLATGLRALSSRLGARGTSEDLEVTRYVIALLHLERKLLRHPTMLETLRIGIERINNQVSFFSLTHSNVIAALGELYQATISTLQPRVMVGGEPTYLADSTRANLIRALLLAGIRAAVLWRQLGGNRWQLFLGRRKILDAAQQLLQQPAN